MSNLGDERTVEVILRLRSEVDELRRALRQCPPDCRGNLAAAFSCGMDKDRPELVDVEDDEDDE